MQLSLSLLPWWRLLASRPARSLGLLAQAFSRRDRRNPNGAGSGSSDAADHGDCRQQLMSALDTQIIPRLVNAHRADEVALRQPQTDRVSAAQIEVFAGVCAAADRGGAQRFIEQMREDGIDAEAVFIDLIGPAARYLGQQWESDALSFSDVTVGLSLMHGIVHEMGYDHHDGPQLAGEVKRIMLACAPGSQHLLGLSMVSEMFRRAGWQVVLEIAPCSAELCRAASNEWFDMIGLSVALDPQLGVLARLVADLKRASRNPQTPVILGGPIFSLRACAPEDFGAQGICRDGRDSIALAARLVSA